MKYKKFIIYNGYILAGTVNFHRDLLPPNFDISKVYGGGLFTINNDEIILYDKSYEFGRYDKDIIKLIPFENNRLQKLKRIYQ